MTRFHNVNGINIPFTPEEEAERDAEEAAWAAGQSSREILEQIKALEATVTPRRLREAVRDSGKAWLDNVDNQIAALRSQLS
jgi:hypothetical protein